MKAELLKHPVCQEITNQNIRFSSCLQCKPCGNDCTIVNNRISFVFDSETIGISYLLLDSKAGQSPVSERFCPKKLLGRKIKVPTSYIRRLTELNLVAKSMKRLISKSNCFSYRASRLQRAARFASEQNKLLFSFDALTSNPS